MERWKYHLSTALAQLIKARGTVEELKELSGIAHAGPQLRQIDGHLETAIADVDRAWTQLVLPGHLRQEDPQLDPAVAIAARPHGYEVTYRSGLRSQLPRAALIAGLVLALALGLGCEGFQKSMRHLQSDISGLCRQVTLYSADGSTIGSWRTVAKIETTDGLASWIGDDDYERKISGTFLIEELTASACQGDGGGL